jgi:hypothetical protein
MDCNYILAESKLHQKPVCGHRGHPAHIAKLLLRPSAQCCVAETFCFRFGSDFQKVSAPAPTLALYLPFITDFILKSGFFMFFMKEYRYQPNLHAGFYTIWILIFFTNQADPEPKLPTLRLRLQPKVPAPCGSGSTTLPLRVSCLAMTGYTVCKYEDPIEKYYWYCRWAISSVPLLPFANGLLPTIFSYILQDNRRTFVCKASNRKVDLNIFDQFNITIWDRRLRDAVVNCSTSLPRTLVRSRIR